MMAVATTPSFGPVLPTTQLVSAFTIALPDTGLTAIASPAAEDRMMESSRFSSVPKTTVISNPHIPTTISTVTRRVSTTTNHFHTTDGPKPQYSGAGKLITSACTQTEYTLVDAGRSLYYAPFIGCINKKTDCCPFAPGPTTRGTFPQPLNQENALLDHCLSAYYSVSGGGCCPSGYTPWTATLGGQTPCFSSIQARKTTEHITSHSGSPATAKPTVAISDAVFAMQFTIEGEANRGLSHGALAGIVVGVLGGLLLLAGLAYMFIRRHRARNSQAIDLKSENGGEDSFRATPTTSSIPAKDELGPTTTPKRTSERSNSRRSIRSGRIITPPPLYQATPLTAESLRELAPLQLQASHPRSVDEVLSQKRLDHLDYLDDVDELCMFDSGASSPVHGVVHEVQLARPQRLSRGYARIIYTQGSASSTQTDGKSIRSNLDDVR